MAPRPTQQRRRGVARRGARLACGVVAASVLASWHAASTCYSVPRDFGSYKLREGKILGSGAYGSVYECEDSGGLARAVKVIPMWRMQLDPHREETRSKLESEIEVHQHIGPHENIVQMVDAVDVKGDVQDWPRWKMIVMELAAGGELGDLLEKMGKMSEAKSRHIFQQVVKAMQHVHGKDVIHRDLKTDNILLCTAKSTDPEKPFVKLIDFGAGHWAKDGTMQATECIGTLETMAPEVILSRGDDFDASDPSQIEAEHEIEFRTRPFGIRKYAPGPGGKGARVIEINEQERYKGDPLGQAWKKGVQKGWVVKSVAGQDVSQMDFEDIMDLMGDRLLDNSSRGAFDGSYKVTGDNKGKGKILPKITMVDLPVTIQYAQVKGKPYSSAVDIWSLGVVLYQMVAGKSPFPAEEPAILEGKYEPLVGVSPQLSDLVSKMLVVEPAQRITMDGVATHPWVGLPAAGLPPPVLGAAPAPAAPVAAAPSAPAPVVPPPAPAPVPVAPPPAPVPVAAVPAPVPVYAPPAPAPVPVAAVPAPASPAAGLLADLPFQVTQADVKASKQKADLLLWSANKLAAEGNPQAAAARQKADDAMAEHEALAMMLGAR